MSPATQTQPIRTRTLAAGFILTALLAFAVAYITRSALGNNDQPSTFAAATSTTSVAAAATTAPATIPTQAIATTTAADTDPYNVFLAHNPDPTVTLSRDDALARAVLGCSTTWPPGTIDRALADAYRPTGLCQR